MSIVFIIVTTFLSAIFRHRIKGLVLLILTPILAVHWFSFAIALVSTGFSLGAWGGYMKSDNPVRDPLLFTYYGKLMNMISTVLIILGIILALLKA